MRIVLGIGEIGFDESVADTVRRDPTVTAAVPMVRGTIGVASENHLARGDTIALSTPTGIGQFTVQGLLDGGEPASLFGGQMAVTDLAAAQMALGREGRVDQIDVVLPEDVAVDVVQHRLQAAVPPMLTVARPSQRGADYDRVLGSFQAMLTGVSLLGLIAGVYIVYNTTATAAGHRALVMAGLRLQGADGRQLFWLLMLEALAAARWAPRSAFRSASRSAV